MLRTAMALSLVALTSFEVFAESNAFIPNHYRGRREINLFSSLGWSKRKEAGLALGRLKTTEKSDSITTDEGTESAAQIQTFYRINEQFNFEGALYGAKSESEDQQNPGDGSDSDTRSVILLGGYEFQDRPFALGLGLTNSNIVTTDKLTDVETTSKVRTISVGGGMRLQEEFYLGFGALRLDAEAGGVDFDTDVFFLGGGRVVGDAANPTAAFEVLLQFQNSDHTQNYTLTGKGLLNHGPTQFYGLLDSSREQGDDKDQSGSLELGLDHVFSEGIFVNPKITLARETDKRTNNPSIETNSSELSLQVGVRKTNFEAYIQVDSGVEKATGGTSDDEDRTTSVSLAGSMFF